MLLIVKLNDSVEVFYLSQKGYHKLYIKPYLDMEATVRNYIWVFQDLL